MRRILIICLAGGALAGAVEPVPASTAVIQRVENSPIDSFVAALARAPSVAAARVRISAAVSAQGAAGVLPDPMLGGDFGRKRPRNGDDMTMYGAMIEQALPRWGERDAGRLNAQAQVSLARAGFATVVGEHAAAVAVAVAEWTAARDTLVLLRLSRGRITSLGEVVRARIAAGGGMISDQLALDTRAQQLDLQITDVERRQADAQAELRGRLGLHDTTELPPFAAPDPGTIRLDGNPMLRTAAAMQVEAQAMEHEADARGNPETVFGLVWEREAAGSMEQTDKLSLSFRVSLPVYRSAYDDAAEAARGRARAARHEASGATWMARSQVGRAQRAAAQAELAEAAADAIAVRTRTEYESVIRQVSSGGATLTAALDLLDRITETGMSAIMARLDSRMALAELWRLAPPELPVVAPVDDDAHHQSR
jgi:outer membrane protein, heavy metal efflux system